MRPFGRPPESAACLRSGCDGCVYVLESAVVLARESAARFQPRRADLVGRAMQRFRPGARRTGFGNALESAVAIPAAERRILSATARRNGCDPIRHARSFLRAHKEVGASSAARRLFSCACDVAVSNRLAKWQF